MRLAMQKLDKAAKRRAIHPNSAARQKSVLSRAVAALAKK
ncbi:MAG: 30S ribosomal protein S20 [Planctomycetota bacterium]